jgi:hypothetical protein
MSDRTEFLHPDFEPGEFDRIERQLRQALARDAAQVRPGDRLDAILHEAHEAGPVTAAGGGGRRWLTPVAAAAAVAAIVGGLWWSGQDDGTEPTPPVTTPSVTTGPTGGTSTPTTGPTTAPTTSSGTATAGPAQTVTLPAYFVGPIGDDKPTYRLFREFLRGEVPAGAGDADKVEAAVALALNAQPFSNTDGYLQPWSGTRVTEVTVTSDAITVVLSGPGAEGFDAEVQRLAVQQLVWTAQAAVGKGTIPVRFQVADGSDRLFGSLPVDRSYNRPPSDRLYEDVAPIWVTSPTRDAVLPAGKAVVAKGLAIVFEANVSWQLERGTTQVGTGFETATVGAPSQGSYEIDLGTLPAGDYTLRVFAMSMEDGDKVAAEDSVSFTVK